MSSIRKMERAERAALAAYRSAAAELVAAQLSEDLNEPSPETARLKRRAAAYRAQWEATSRRVEDAITSRESAA